MAAIAGHDTKKGLNSEHPIEQLPDCSTQSTVLGFGGMGLTHLPQSDQHKAKGRMATGRGGLALAYLPPSARKQKRIAGTPAQRNRGLALLMVMFLLVLATSIIIDLQYDARIQLQLAANSRNSLQAEYLARSSLQFTHLLLAFNSQFVRMKEQFKRFLKMAPPEVQILLNRLQLWRIVPVDCGLLKQLFGGGFGKAERDTKAAASADGGKLYPFGDFLGGCKATLEDESSKINLNRFSNYNDARVLWQQLENLFAPEKYNPIFERTHPHGNNVSRREQIAAIQDWVDLDNQVAGETGTSEDSKYRYEERGYMTKNSYFDSIEELRLIYGIDDLFYENFAKFFTVYGPTMRININEATPEVLSALVMTYAELKPQERAIFFDPIFQRFMQAMIAYRSYLGFNSRDEFVRWVANPVILDPQMYPSAQGADSQMMQGELPKFKLNTQQMGSIILTDADTFRVTAVGQVGTVERRITAVIHVQPRGKRDIYYWRLH